MRLRISRAPAAEAAEGAARSLFPRAALVLALLAIFVRLIYCGAVYPHVGPRLGWSGVDDGYDEIARTLLDGKGYAFSATAQPNVKTPPGYAFTLAGLFALTGQRSGEGWHSGSSMRSPTEPPPSCSRSTGAGSSVARGRGCSAAAAWALYPQIIVYAARPFSEIPFTLLLLVLALSTARFLRTGYAIDGVWTGLLWGLAVLFKEKLILLPLPIAAILWKRQHRRGRPFLAPVLAMAVAMTVVVTPWLLRQHAVTGRWVPITARSGNAVQFGLDTDFTRPDVQADEFVRSGRDSTGNMPAQDLSTGFRRIAASPSTCEESS